LNGHERSQLSPAFLINYIRLILILSILHVVNIAPSPVVLCWIRCCLLICGLKYAISISYQRNNDKQYLQKGDRGNKPCGIELMLRLYVPQNLYTPSDGGTVAEAIDSRAFSDFCGAAYCCIAKAYPCRERVVHLRKNRAGSTSYTFKGSNPIRFSIAYITPSSLASSRCRAIIQQPIGERSAR
jgi:hypothetical protein